MTGVALSHAAEEVESTQLKSWLHETLKIQLVESGAAFTLEELRTLHEELTQGPLNRFVPPQSELIIEKRAKRGESPARYGSFNPKLRRIRIIGDSPQFKRVFVHEYMHVIAADYPLLFRQFCVQSGWTIGTRQGETYYAFNGIDPLTGSPVDEVITSFEVAQTPHAVIQRLAELPIFPSDYSKLGPAEMFAETGTATVFEMENDRSTDYRLTEFRGTPLFGWWHELFIFGAKR